MTTLTFVTPEEFQQLTQRVDLLAERLSAYVETTDDDVDTATALKITGIKSRTTLIWERKQPGSLLKYSTHGRSVSYSRKSCIDYKQAARRAKAAAAGSTTAPMRIAS